MNIILFGFKGCGKSFFGHKLALAMDRPFIDTDRLLIDRWMNEGNKETTAPEIIRKTGNAVFRQMESHIIASLDKVQNSVIAVGGGAVLDPENVKLLREIGRLAFLDTSLETVLNRKLDTALGSLEKLYEERYPIYSSIEAARIDVDSLTNEEVIGSLISLAQLRTPHHGIQ